MERLAQIPGHCPLMESLEVNEGCVANELIALRRSSQKDHLCRLGCFREYRAKSPEASRVRKAQYVIQNYRGASFTVSPIRVYQDGAGQCGYDRHLLLRSGRQLIKGDRGAIHSP